MSEALIVLVDKLAVAANEANDYFDELAFQDEAFPCGGDCTGTYLAAELDFLRAELNKLALDLRTLGVPA